MESTTMMAETAKFRLGAGDAVAATQPDASIAAAFGNRFATPLDFEILTDHGPFYQAGLNDRLTFELTFNDYGRDITSTDKSASYTITNIIARVRCSHQSIHGPREPHSAIICGQTGSGKTQFVLDELLHPDHGYYWHKAHFKVTPVQRTLGKFYRPASITKVSVIWTTICGSAESLNQKRSRATVLCDSGFSTSIACAPPAAAAAAAASLDTLTK